MTQRERILSMLKQAGREGVRSDAFYAAFLPRAGARIWELRQEGYEITSEREKQFVRYRLKVSAGVGRGNVSGLTPGSLASGHSPDPGGDSPNRLFEEPKPPSAYDPYSEAA